MCGIAGYVGKNKVKKELINILRGVEYRGYDSAGFAYIKNKKIEVKKTQGCIDNLNKYLTDDYTKTCGIAHTRWATHGKVNATNAHPILSEDKKWAVVHNGIIENFMIIKNQLKENYGVKFATETDTEVVAQMLQTSHIQSPLKALKLVCKKLIGSYALAIINKDFPNQIFVARKESPLYISHSENGSYIASDPICFVNKCQNYFTLENGEFGIVTDNNVFIYDNYLNQIIKEPTKLNLKEKDAGLGKYKYFMQKEITEEDVATERIIKTYSENNVFKKLNLDYLKSVKNIILIGCGTAYHAGLMGAKIFEKYARIKSSAFVASEYRYSNPIIDQNTLAIFVSQSGETADTLGACNVLKQMGVKTIALTNVLYSTLAQNCDYVFPVCAGPEIAVASTKAYTCQIAIIYLFAKYLSSIKSGEDFVALQTISKFKNLEENYFEQIDILANDLLHTNSVFFIGRDVDYVTAEEASLKLKEISYINSSAYPAGELKHGFLALVDNTSIIFVIATQKELLDKTLNGAHEGSARGAKIIVVSNLDISKDKLVDVYMHIKLKNESVDIMPMVAIKFFQWLAYFTSVKKGLNPDKPRNLAKSVTVE